MQKKRTRALRTEPGWIAFSLFCGAISDRLEFVDIRQLCALQDVDHEAGGESEAKLEGFYFGLGQDLVEGVYGFLILLCLLLGQHGLHSVAVLGVQAELPLHGGALFHGPVPVIQATEPDFLQLALC